MVEYQTHNSNAKTNHTCYLQAKILKSLWPRENPEVSVATRNSRRIFSMYCAKPFITRNKSFNGGFILGKGCFVVGFRALHCSQQVNLMLSFSGQFLFRFGVYNKPKPSLTLQKSIVSILASTISLRELISRLMLFSEIRCIGVVLQEDNKGE